MWPYILALTLSYLLLVRLLRYRMYNHLHTKYSTYLANPNKMPYQTAHDILKTIMLYESPFIFGFSLQWALIKSYSIANGTKLLVATRRLTDTRQVAKRSEDTGIILAEILVSGIDSERGRTALAKMNWIHAQYGNRISNGDLIHTLALFVLEPARWARRWDWRGMSVLEETALWCYWREVGMRMGMKDLPSTLDELKIWTKEYERTEMRYSGNNRKCYDATVGLFLRDSPVWLKPWMQKIADAFLEPYVRPTLGVDAPPAWAFWVVDVGFGLRAFYIRYLSLPRFKFLETGARKGVDGRIQRNRWLFEPWYVGETIGSRMRRFLGLGKRERVPGPQWFSQGYLPEELGPHEFLQRSREPVLEQAEQLKVYAENGGSSTMGCPFAFAGR